MKKFIGLADKYSKLLILIFALFAIAAIPSFLGNRQTLSHKVASQIAVGVCTPGATQCPGGVTGYDNHAYFQTCNSNGAWSNQSCPSNYYCYSNGSSASCVGACALHSNDSCQSGCFLGQTQTGYYCQPGFVCCAGSPGNPTPTPTPQGSSCNSSNCYGHVSYECTGFNPVICCDFTSRCVGNSCQSACHAQVPSNYCRGSCGLENPPATCNSSICNGFAGYFCTGAHSYTCGSYIYVCSKDQCTKQLTSIVPTSYCGGVNACR